jgi:hypothetical protein
MSFVWSGGPGRFRKDSREQFMYRKRRRKFTENNIKIT